MKYTVPKSGFYQISANCTYYKGTGNFETVKNPNKKWFQFWKPKTVTQEIYERTDSGEVSQLYYLSEGASVESNTQPNRIVLK